MAKIKLVVIKEADVTNNCPECFNQDLKLSFYQKHSYGKFVHKTTNEVTHKLTCNTCKSDIYPVNWTDDIERIFGYYQKMAIPEKKSVKYTALFYVLTFSLITLIGVGIYLLASGIIPF
ncbi:hypothetical protein [Maribacter sp.]|uniref:hypothetical protein n=1 Tax=Maribacter sp. TaxID=1897614 RepID=UPI0025C3E71D|nr:hypothetical protein [Maribacter sp.]